MRNVWLDSVFKHNSTTQQATRCGLGASQLGGPHDHHAKMKLNRPATLGLSLDVGSVRYTDCSGGPAITHLRVRVLSPPNKSQ